MLKYCLFVHILPTAFNTLFVCYLHDDIMDYGVMVVPSSASVGEVYEEHRDEDGFLYVQFSGENTFGLTDYL